MKIQFKHINIVAKDWKKLANFYIEVFNCEIIPPERDLSGDWLDRLTGISSAKIEGAHLLLPGAKGEGPTLEIFQYKETVKNIDREINRQGFSHIAFAVDDVERCLARLKEKGGTTVGELVTGHVENVGNIKVVYARDPEGNIIEILKWS